MTQIYTNAWIYCMQLLWKQPLMRRVFVIICARWSHGLCRQRSRCVMDACTVKCIAWYG